LAFIIWNIVWKKRGKIFFNINGRMHYDFVYA